MEKSHYPRWLTACAFALAAYLAHHEFETIKSDQRADRVSITALTSQVAQLSGDIRVLIAQSQMREKSVGLRLTK